MLNHELSPKQKPQHFAKGHIKSHVVVERMGVRVGELFPSREVLDRSGTRSPKWTGSAGGVAESRLHSVSGVQSSL